MEQMHRRIEELEQELANERQLSKELRQKMAERSAHSSSEESLRTELSQYKAKLSALQENYEMSLLAGNSGSSLPGTLLIEYQRYCQKHKIFPELSQKQMSVEDAISVLKSLMPRKSRNVTEMELHDRIRGLEEELKSATESTLGDAQQLKNKIFQLSERIRTEKEYKRAAESEASACKKKIAMLGDHMEKLIVHLKRESAHKLRLAEQLRVSEKDGIKLKEKCELMTKKIAAKDRLLFELREGSKVLEDQLRLMDEKYLELRGKLDWARTVAAKKIKKAEKTATDLRVKFAMTGSTLLLDNVSLPEGYGAEHGDQQSLGSWASQGINPMSMSLDMRGRPPSNRAFSSRVGRSGDSVRSFGSQRSEPSLDAVLEKIRTQQGAKQEWSEEKLKQLVKSR